MSRFEHVGDARYSRELLMLSSTRVSTARMKEITMTARLSLASSLALLLFGTACGDDTTGTGGSASGGGPAEGGAAPQAGNGPQGGETPGGGAPGQGGMGGTPVADSEPMGIDCSDTCPSFEGRTYVCTFLPGFPTTVGYCSVECTADGPTCPDTEPGEVYCNPDVGSCVIGCPFDVCPNDMSCTFNFDNEPACEPTP